MCVCVSELTSRLGRLSRLFVLSVPLLIPYIDTLHATMLFWLRPSKQIRAPIYSFKQRAARRKIVVKYTILYCCVIGVFAALIILPLVFQCVSFFSVFFGACVY
jgi:hypothetical protein